MLKTSLSLIALVISSQSFADDALNKKLTAEEMEHVVVSGSRVFESIDEVPASVTIINQQEIIF